MKEGDIVYVARNGVSQIGYILENFNPLSTLLAINQLTATE
jgi:polysaccharide export outer membrane protein